MKVSAGCRLLSNHKALGASPQSKTHHFYVFIINWHFWSSRRFVGVSSSSKWQLQKGHQSHEFIIDAGMKWKIPSDPQWFGPFNVQSVCFIVLQTADRRSSAAFWVNFPIYNQFLYDFKFASLLCEFTTLYGTRPFSDTHLRVPNLEVDGWLGWAGTQSCIKLVQYVIIHTTCGIKLSWKPPVCIYSPV